MKRWHCSFHGRRAGAIGIFYHACCDVSAEDIEKAHLAIYEAGWDHLSDVRIVEIPSTEESETP